MSKYSSRLTVNQMLVGFFFLTAGMFLALAVMDYTVMHGSWRTEYPDYLYRYWIAVHLVVASVAGLATWMAYAAGLPRKRAPAVFFSIILLFIAGLLDIFYFVLATLKGEGYTFDVWSAQYKWFGYWDWPRQILWTAGCFLVIALLWYKTKD